MHAVHEASKARRAALAIHALSRMERATVIAGLTDSAKQQLLPLLDELEALGIPPEAGSMVSLPGPVESAGPVNDGEVAARELIRCASAQSAARALQGQSPATIRTILGAEDWPWRRGYLASLPDHARRELDPDASVSSAGVPRAVIMELLNQLVLALQAQKGSSERLSRNRWWSRWLGKA